MQRPELRCWTAAPSQPNPNIELTQIYANEFTEQELKDLATFYKSPLGQKLISAEPRAIGLSMAFMNAWAQDFSTTVVDGFRAEMKKRGKEI